MSADARLLQHDPHTGTEANGGTTMSRKAIRRLCIAAGVTLVLLCGSQVAASAADPPPPPPHTVAAEAAACASLYRVPANIGPDPLSACQWDMRAIGATPAGSYAVNQGKGARIG